MWYSKPRLFQLLKHGRGMLKIRLSAWHLTALPYRVHHASSHMAATASSADLDALFSAAHSVCVLTGAGISRESGVPTFRGEDGLWRKYRAEDLATPEAFARDPLLVWEWYAWRRELISQAQPNAAHLALVDLESRIAARPNGRFTLITQNVDGLHERAGSLSVVRLHGSIWHLRCSRCGAEREDRRVPLDSFPPRCAQPGCSALLRPAVVWFGEPLPDAEWKHATLAAAHADVFLVVGTSALVYPTASLPWAAKQSGARLIEINPAPTPLSDLADCVLRGPAAEILGELKSLKER
jgi:NAD-dependent deacetylase